MSRPIKIIIDARFTGYEVYEELNYPISYPPIGKSSNNPDIIYTAPI